MNYDVYHFSFKEWMECMLLSTVITGVITWLLYRTLWGAVLIIAVLPYVCIQKKRAACKRRKQLLLTEFKVSMQCVITSLRAGYSMENAWREAEKEAISLLGEKAMMVQELRQMNGAVRMNKALEVELQAFAVRSGCEDIQDFAEVFIFAKRSGGNFPGIIRRTVEKISEKVEVEQEIETLIAGKMMELKIMNLVPVFILCYLNVTSPTYLQALYGNLFGRCFMTAGLIVYVTAVELGRKIMNIEV